MTTTSQVPDVIDYLVAQCQASANLGASTSARVRVIDGPPPADDVLAEQRILYIGWDQVTGSAGGDVSAQAWPVIDMARTRDEDGTITCTADAWTGDSVLKTARDMCAAVVAGVELLLRGNGQTGPGDTSMGGLVYWSEVGELRWYPRQSQQGAGMACVFTVEFHTRLTTTGA